MLLLDGEIADSSEEVAVKSLAIAVVAPEAPDTANVQVTGTFFLAPGLMLVHDKLDAAVGTPTTLKLSAPLAIVLPPTAAVMENDDVDDCGVNVKVNVAPLLFVLRGTLEVPVADTAKSAATAVVAPCPPCTNMVHGMAVPVRCGFPTVHVSDEADVGVP